MRYAILGFNQKLAIENDLSVNDLLLLQYIMYANSNPSLSHVAENEISYVWLSHSKIHEDLPILNYTEGSFRNKLSELKKKGFIDSKSFANKQTKGTRAYYTITKKTMSLINDEENTTMSHKNDMETVPCHFKMTSDKLLNIDKVLSNDILSKDNISTEDCSTTFQFGTKQHKPTLYEKCISVINEFTNIPKLRELLIQYLKVGLEMKSIKGVNQWKGMVNNTLVEAQKKCEPHTYEEIVQVAIDHSWKTFYPIKDYNNSNSGKKFDDLIRHDESYALANHNISTKEF